MYPTKPLQPCVHIQCIVRSGRRHQVSLHTNVLSRGVDTASLHRHGGEDDLERLARLSIIHGVDLSCTAREVDRVIRLVVVQVRVPRRAVRVWVGDAERTGGRGNLECV